MFLRFFFDFFLLIFIDLGFRSAWHILFQLLYCFTLYIHLFVCMSVFHFVCSSVCLFNCLFIFCLFICLFVNLCVCLLVGSSFYSFVCLFVFFIWLLSVFYNCLSISLLIHLFLYLSVHVSAHLCIHVCLSISLLICLFTYCLFICLFIFPFNCVSVHLPNSSVFHNVGSYVFSYAYLSVCLCIHPFICLFVYPSFNLPISLIHIGLYHKIYWWCLSTNVLSKLKMTSEYSMKNADLFLFLSF